MIITKIIEREEEKNKFRRGGTRVLLLN